MNIKSELMIINGLTKNVKKSELIIVDKFEEEVILCKWRQALNPFISYGYNHGSCYSFNSQKNLSHQLINDQQLVDEKPTSGEHCKRLASVSNNIDERTDKSPNTLEKNTMQPYYIENFEFIIKSVIDSDRNKAKLFSDEEHCIIKKFHSMCVRSRMLFVRLFQRKRNWIRVEKIQYDEIQETNMDVVLKELCDNEFLLNEEHCSDFDEVMSLLSLQDVKTLVTEFKITKITSKLGKSDLIKVLKESSKKQKTLFFSKGSSMMNLIMKRAKKLLGHFIKVNEAVAGVFTRIITYFLIYFYDNSISSNSILYVLLQIKLGQIAFPTYDARLPSGVCLFKRREEFVKYAKAKELEKDFFMLMESHDYTEAYKIFVDVLLLLKNSLMDQTEVLPEQTALRTISEQFVLLQLCRHSVTLLEKEKKYSEAVLMVDILLKFPYFKAKHRGMLWERKIIDLERHIKDSEKAIETLQSALEDINVRGGFRYSLLQRLQAKTKKKKIRSMHLEELCQFQDIKEECLQAQILMDTTSSNRAIFMSKDSTGGSAMSCVEQYVLSHYNNNGYPCGVHDEGAVVMTLFLLFFWDIIFSDVPFAFLSSYQDCPIDFFTDGFYVERKDVIDRRLQFIYNATEQELQNEITKSWKGNYGVSCPGANWEIFECEQDALNVVVCLGGHLLGGLCELYCKDLHTRRSGFPDLLVWNVETKSFKIIEVKGPGDKLSTKQIIWLHILNHLGAETVVCHVTGVGAKRKRLSLENSE